MKDHSVLTAKFEKIKYRKTIQKYGKKRRFCALLLGMVYFCSVANTWNGVISNEKDNILVIYENLHRYSHHR